MQNYNKPEANKPEKKPMQPVVEAVKTKKKSNLRRDAENVAEYSWRDILLPALKSTFTDMVTNGLRMLLYPGEDYRSSRRDYSSYSRGSGYTNYRQYSREPERRVETRREPSRSRHQVDEVYLATRGEAERVRDALNDAIDMYNHVTVADFYDACNLDHTYVDNNWGWYDLTDMRIISTRDGYLLDMPRIEPI